MKLVPSTKRPCRLERGEIRRVPQDRTNLLVGYHVCCPRCGFNTPALAGNDGLQRVDDDSRHATACLGDVAVLVDVDFGAIGILA